MRTTYTRLALQSSMNNHLRLTIDRDITVVDETKAVADVNNDAIVKIPYSVFEVKVAEGESPKFLEDLVVSNAIIEAKKVRLRLVVANIYSFKYNYSMKLLYLFSSPNFLLAQRSITRKQSVPSPGGQRTPPLSRCSTNQQQQQRICITPVPNNHHE